ncbi:hypothetical protein VCHA50P415_10534 [Vibrio chagasii]|nr:hypothetical protein VCHA27O13_10508 [Vibrio chagasii]CAH6813364.1 hypothetical protein VCHA31O73_150017 [Vibrio chagasii]CAH6821698.1 hypothetical protein VCHA35O143_160017 [Vibrio chagasii]CAH6829019.1 hypothetical protein VCHA35O141_170110 [Vibrio chagasii]CAH6841263.1 hypothetical protein VCHA34P131_10434 [Vibrio chagasii]
MAAVHPKNVSLFVVFICLSSIIFDNGGAEHRLNIHDLHVETSG